MQCPYLALKYSQSLFLYFCREDLLALTSTFWLAHCVSSQVLSSVRYPPQMKFVPILEAYIWYFENLVEMVQKFKRTSPSYLRFVFWKSNFQSKVMFLILYRKSIGLLVKLLGRLQRRGDFCLKESIRQPLCLIWLCLKEPDQKGNSHSCPSSCKKSSSIHCHNKRNMTFLLSVEIAVLAK